MYEAVHAYPDGESTVARQALTASDHGFDGIVVRNHGNELPEYDPVAISEQYEIDVATGVEIRAADPSQASGFVGNHRPAKTIVAVHGGDRQLNRFAVEQPAVDVLAHPMRGDGDFNHVLAAEAATNGVRIEFSLRPVLRERGGRRVRAIQQLRKLRELVQDADAPYVFSADPHDHLQLRAPRDLVGVGQTLGFEPEEVREGFREWGRLVQRNRERQSDSYVEPGVWIDSDDTE